MCNIKNFINNNNRHEKDIQNIFNKPQSEKTMVFIKINVVDKLFSTIIITNIDGKNKIVIKIIIYLSIYYNIAVNIT